jgi:AcrR family transcriptional regulator
MGLAFTAAERERISELLLETGQRLFSAQGLSKTSLAELVAPAGIAATSFYAFFPAKEALYLELMIRKAATNGAELVEALAQRPARAALVAAMRLTVRMLDGDPLYRRLLTHPGELAAVGRRLGPAELQRIEPHVLHPLIDFITRAQAAGEIVSASPAAVVGVLRSIGLLVMHRDEIGDAHPAVLDLAIESLATGLTTRLREEPDHGIQDVGDAARLRHER